MAELRVLNEGDFRVAPLGRGQAAGGRRSIRGRDVSRGLGMWSFLQSGCAGSTSRALRVRTRQHETSYIPTSAAIAWHSNPSFERFSRQSSARSLVAGHSPLRDAEQRIAWRGPGQRTVCSRPARPLFFRTFPSRFIGRRWFPADAYNVSIIRYR